MGEAVPPGPGPGDGRAGTRLVWLRQISFRSRISVLVGMAVGVSVALAALVCYVAVSHQMQQQATSSLENAVGSAPDLVHMGLSGPTVDLGQLANFQDRTGDFVQVISAHQVITQKGETTKRLIPLTRGAREALQSGPNGSAPIETVSGTNGGPYRVASVPSDFPGIVVQVLYPLTNMYNTLDFLRLILILVAIGGVALATCLGWAVGRASIRPVEDLTLAAEHVAETQDLTATIDDEGKDELARLARSFNAMLGALSASQHQQAQLVADAGHELRTPLTSLRTNIEVLMRAKDLQGPDRDELLADVDSQLKELSTLVGDLVDLAREDERPGNEPQVVELSEIVERAVERAQRRALSVHFDVSLQPGRICANPALLERAVMNVLDNAAKWSPPGGHVGVTLVADGSWHLTVSDQGPGISADDLPHIFDRFYRAPSARSMPGSGLGLAIVKRVVTSHGGNVQVASGPPGGTTVEITLPLDTGLDGSDGGGAEA